MPYILCCIDLQSHFLVHKNYNSVIFNVQKEIKRAIAVNAYIIFVQYKGAGDTLKSLVSLTKNYSKVFFADKDIDDGSSWIIEVLIKNNIKPRLIKIVGVQTDMCVHDTVEGLTNVSPMLKVHVMKYACGAIYPRAHVNALNFMSKFPNVTVV